MKLLPVLLLLLGCATAPTIAPEAEAPLVVTLRVTATGDGPPPTHRLSLVLISEETGRQRIACDELEGVCSPHLTDALAAVQCWWQGETTEYLLARGETGLEVRREGSVLCRHPLSPNTEVRSLSAAQEQRQDAPQAGAQQR